MQFRYLCGVPLPREVVVLAAIRHRCCILLCILTSCAACTDSDPSQSSVPQAEHRDEPDNGTDTSLPARPGAPHTPVTGQSGDDPIVVPEELTSDAGGHEAHDAADHVSSDPGLPCAVSELLSSHCVSCHDGTGVKAPMALRQRGDLVRALLRDPARSVADEALVRMRSSSAPMPPDARLSNAQLEAFADWVADGSPADTCDDPDQPSVQPFEPSSLSSALAKVKLLLTGREVTPDELGAASTPGALAALIDAWQQTPEFDQKMLSFFEVAFQQSELTTSLLFEQLGATVPGDALLLSRLVENLEQSFARTALRIVKSGSPFTETLTTNRFELTPALMSYLSLLDDQPISDLGRRTRTPVPFSVRTEGAPIPYLESIDAAASNYLQFTAIGASNGCVQTTRSSRSGVELFSFLFGRTPRLSGCNPSRSTPIFTEEDFGQFRTVQIERALAGQTRVRFFDLPALRSASTLALTIPRVGFFSTPAFFANYPTNDSNTMRVTANQTMIVALARSFDGSDVSAPLTNDGLSGTHALPGSACYACHKTLDPMRMFFRQAFTLGYSEQRDASLLNQRASFTLDGVGVQGVGLTVLARGLAEHPLFAHAWTQKLCHHANAGPCSELDPEFARIAAAFADSAYDFRVLVRELFSSPLVTGLTPTLSAGALGSSVGIARRNHFCQALSVRLGIADPCGQTANASRSAVLAAPVAEMIPEDSYSRGLEAPVTPNQINLFTRAAYESLCVMMAAQVLGTTADSPLSPSDPQGTLRALRSKVMGLPDGDPRAQPAQAILSEHYNRARNAGRSSVDALRSSFVLACTSPSSVSVGL